MHVQCIQHETTCSVQAAHLCKLGLLTIPNLLGLLQVLCSLSEELLAGQDDTQFKVVLQKCRMFEVILSRR